MPSQAKPGRRPIDARPASAAPLALSAALLLAASSAWGACQSRQPDESWDVSHGRFDALRLMGGSAPRDLIAVAGIFQWVADFKHQADVQYRAMIHPDGTVEAAMLHRVGAVRPALHAFRRVCDGVPAYYNLRGGSLMRLMLRTPVAFSRISSHFDEHRVHPIRGRRQPHRGVDYAAPLGAPVLASAAGVVREMGHHHANGHYVVLHHAALDVDTKYLHLQRFAPRLRRGDAVGLGQLIGHVGQSGLAHGPHLHYEVLASGVHVDPRSLMPPPQRRLPSVFQRRHQRHADRAVTLMARGILRFDRSLLTRIH